MKVGNYFSEKLISWGYRSIGYYFNMHGVITFKNKKKYKYESF